MMGVRPRVYLAGPMTGKTGANMDAWREYVRDRLGRPFVCLSPTRDKPFLHKPGVLGSKSYTDEPCYWAKPQNFAARDEHDIRNADVVIMNLLGHPAGAPLSIGTLMEAGMARGLHKPLVVIMEEHSQYNSSLLPQWATFIASGVEEAVSVVRSLFAK